MSNMILLDVDGISKREVILNMSQELLKAGKISDQTVFVESVLEREAEITTGFGNGVAIPHGKSDTVLESSFIFGKLRNKVEWESLDDEPVDLVFLLSIRNDGGDQQHLRMLSRIAMAIMEEEFTDYLRKEKEVEKIQKILDKI